MSESPSHLRFRAEERREVAMAASLSIPGAVASQVRLAPGVLSKHSRIDGTLMDISGGGAGLVIGEYLPKWCPVILGVHRRTEDERTLVQAEGMIRRVQMLDRRPSYLIGVSFESLDDTTVVDLEYLLAEIDGVTHGGGAP